MAKLGDAQLLAFQLFLGLSRFSRYRPSNNSKQAIAKQGNANENAKSKPTHARNQQDTKQAKHHGQKTQKETCRADSTTAKQPHDNLKMLQQDQPASPNSAHLPTTATTVTATRPRM